MGDPIRIGIAGCGAISNCLLEGAKAGGISIAAVCDLDEQRARAAALPFAAEVYTSIDTMLADAGLTGVIVALPSHLHHDAAVMALQAGMHVFCEKPLTHKLELSLDLAERAAKSGKVFQIGYMKRFNPAFSAIKQRLEFIAPVTGASIRLTVNGDPALQGKPAAPQSWHSDLDKAGGGGFLVHSGSHLLDLMMHFFGLPESVWGHLEREISGNEYSNTFLFKMASGVFVSLQMCMTRAQGFSYAGSIWEEKVEVTGLNGRLSGEDADWMGHIPSRAFVHMADGDGPKALFTLWESQWALELQSFVEGIEMGRCLGSTVVDGVRVDYLLSELRKLEHGDDIVRLQFPI